MGGRRTKPVSQTAKSIAATLKGHCNYYGVNGNLGMIRKFYSYVKFTFYRMLNRRDQKGRYRYEKFKRLWYFYVQSPRLSVNIWN
ncbi:MAG: hypothetical protein LBI42_04515 [Chitinispirillales bacterium]|nr:hypothetical protein [Chitinispirillales bacterium]